MNTGFSVSQSFATSIETSPRGILKPQVAPPRPVVRFDEVPAKGRYWLAVIAPVATVNGSSGGTMGEGGGARSASAGVSSGDTATITDTFTA